MKSLTLLLLFAVGLLLGPQALLAANYVVGTCVPRLPSYPTISAAVGTVPSGSTVMVCPGIYSEQVTISTSLTLEGITSGNGARAVIEVPTGGLTTSITNVIFGGTVYPQVIVSAPNVNITNITVDGTGNNLNCSASLYGIYYATGASGTVNQVTTRQQINDGCGVGIWVENGSSTAESVTIENSDTHDADNTGIFVGSNQTPPTLNVTVKGNDVAGGPAGPTWGITSWGVAGSITDNVVTDASSFGIIGESGATASISANTISNTEANINVVGIFLEGSGEIARDNTIMNHQNGSGIWITDTTATVQDNKITNSNVAIEFFCTSATVSANTISDAAIGIDNVPSGLAVASLYNRVDVIRTNCR